jgi:NAD(P)-dependent dehydrogenase (short-subunit alcohol dehydrogenase family)
MTRKRRSVEVLPSCLFIPETLYILASRAAFPHLQAAGTGVIINFARAGQPQANMVAYNCAKAGIEALTRTLALEGRDLGIRVNAIAPGLVDTASNIAAMKPKDLKRWTKREDIAKTVLFLPCALFR